MFADRARMAAAGRSAEGGNDSYTKLLMHMEGTDDAQVFTDSSIGNLVKSDPGTGFSDAFGVFDGTGDYLSLADHADWDLVADTTDYTVEFWVKHTDHAGTETYITQYEDVDNNWMIYHVHGTGIYFNVQSGAGSVIQINSGDEIVDNEWHHIALSKDATVYTLFLDGVDIGTTTDASTDTFAGALLVGSDGTNAFAGSIDEVRISNVDRYTSGFTPQTANHSNDGNTLLLLHMDMPNTDPESFTDSSTTGHTVTQNGNAYQKARNLGIIGTSCGYFDGTGDYLSISDSEDWDFDSGNFTLEAWIYLTNVTTANSLIMAQYVDADNSWYIRTNNNGSQIQFRAELATTELVNLDVAHGIPVNTWAHIAVVRNGNEWDIYRDGVSLANTTDADDMPNLATALTIGEYASGAMYMNGYIEDLRIVKGTAVYTANFNPPTTALTDITNTKLLLHFDAGEGVVAVTDSSSSNHTANITENGNFIQVIGHGADAVNEVNTEETAFKWGTTSAYFDGTADEIRLADSTDWDLAANTDNYTVDFWVKHDDHAGTETYVCHFEDANNNWQIYHVHGTGIYFNVQSASSSIVQINSGDEITDTDWHHIALVKNATVYKLYLGGTEIGTTTDASVDTFAGDLIVGSDETNDFAGYIDELRISKGIARWTANFTPPNAAYYE